MKTITFNEEAYYGNNKPLLSTVSCDNDFKIVTDDLSNSADFCQFNINSKNKELNKYKVDFQYFDYKTTSKRDFCVKITTGKGYSFNNVISKKYFNEQFKRRMKQLFCKYTIKSIIEMRQNVEEIDKIIVREFNKNKERSNNGKKYDLLSTKVNDIFIPYDNDNEIYIKNIMNVSLSIVNEKLYLFNDRFSHDEILCDDYSFRNYSVEENFLEPYFNLVLKRLDIIEK